MRGRDLGLGGAGRVPPLVRWARGGCRWAPSDVQRERNITYMQRLDVFLLLFSFAVIKSVCMEF